MLEAAYGVGSRPWRLQWDIVVHGSQRHCPRNTWGGQAKPPRRAVLPAQGAACSRR